MVGCTLHPVIGIAAQVNVEQTDLTRPGLQPMTPAYASPERLRGGPATAAGGTRPRCTGSMPGPPLREHSICTGDADPSRMDPNEAEGVKLAARLPESVHGRESCSGDSR